MRPIERELAQSAERFLATRRLPHRLYTADVDEVQKVMRLVFFDPTSDGFVSVDCPITATKGEVQRAIALRLRRSGAAPTRNEPSLVR